MAQPADFGVIQEAAAGDHIQFFAVEGLDRIAHGGGLMLAIAVHHHGHRMQSGHEAFFDGTGQAGTPHPLDDPNARILAGQMSHQIRCPVP